MNDLSIDLTDPFNTFQAKQEYHLKKFSLHGDVISKCVAGALVLITIAFLTAGSIGIGLHSYTTIGIGLDAGGGASVALALMISLVFVFYYQNNKPKILPYAFKG